MWVKICANTNLDDALAAVKLGADAVGFVFAPSKRQVQAAQVRAITDRLPSHVERVGVFSCWNVDEIAETVLDAGLTTVQMHGGINLPATRALRERLGGDISVLHVVHWTIGEDWQSAHDLGTKLESLRWAEEAGDRVLLDARVGKSSGGLGRTFNWGLAKEVLADFPQFRLIVAGGLDPENVAEAIRVLQPYGVDVASGVELAPGKKDPAKLRKFIENARRA